MTTKFTTRLFGVIYYKLYNATFVACMGSRSRPCGRPIVVSQHQKLEVFGFVHTWQNTTVNNQVHTSLWHVKLVVKIDILVVLQEKIKLSGFIFFVSIN